MFYSVNSYSSASSRNGMSGLVSGMDTDTMVEQMTSGTRNKITSKLQKKQLAQWRQDAYRNIIKETNAFRTKYLSYTSGNTNIMSPNFFNTSTIKCSSDYVSVSGSADAAKNVKINDIISMADTASFTTNKKFSNAEITTGKILEDWDCSVVNTQSVNIKIDGVSHAFTIGGEFQFEEGLNDTQKIQAVVAELNKSAKDSNLDDKVKFELVGDKLYVDAVSKDGKKPELQFNGGSKDLLAALGLPEKEGTEKGDSLHGDKSIEVTGLYGRKNLGEMLAGSSMSLTFNGVTKTIKFNETDKDSFKTPEKLAAFMQKATDQAFGFDKVKVNMGTDGKMTFKTKDANDIFTLTGADKAGILGTNGAFHVLNGSSNRISWNKSMKDLVNAGQFGDSSKMKADKDGNYMMKINGKVITINEKDLLSTALSKINNSDAGVKITYSTTSDTFSMSAKESGANGQVTVGALNDKDGLVVDGDKSNDLGEVFFGTLNDKSVVNGRDAQIEVSFDGGRTSTIVTRSTNNFTLDGLTINIKGQAEKDPIDLAGKTMTVKYDDTDDGVDNPTDFEIGLPADFKLNPKDSSSQRELKILNALNDQLLAKFGTKPFTPPVPDTNPPSVDPKTPKLSFAYTSDQKDYILKSSEGKEIKIDINKSNADLLNSIGFGEIGYSSSDKTFAIGTGECITLKPVKEDISFTVETNIDDTVAKLQTFIEDYNKLIKLCDDKMSEKGDRDYSPLTDEQKKDMSEDEIKKWEEQAKKGILQNDNYLNTFVSELRSTMLSTTSGSKMALYNIGIKTTDWEENGQLHITDEAALRKALSEDPDAVVNLFTKSVNADIPEGASIAEKKKLEKEAVSKSGLAVKLDYLINATTGTFGGDGVLVKIAGLEGDSSVGQDSISRQIKDIDKQLQTLKRSLEAEETRYFKQFAAMEKYISQMNSQSSWLSQQFE